MLPGSVIFYINYYFIFPLKGPQKALALIGSFIIILGVFSYWQIGMHTGVERVWLALIGILFITCLYLWVPFTVLSLIVYFINRSRLQKEVHKQVLKQNEESELALLKAQLNPHFLFNTLNNIDTLIHVDEKDKASESLIRMSDMMRYTTYESSNEKVLLTQEVEYLRNFIELQVLRLSNKELIDFNVHGDIGTTLITPMLLIPFVENAFKHASDKKSPKAIRIQLRVDYGILYFNCMNKYDEMKMFSKDKSGGVGLANIQRRLQLLYPDQHQLEISKNDGNYTTTLKINLNELELHNN